MGPPAGRRGQCVPQWQVPHGRLGRLLHPPKGGLPTIPELGWEHVPTGTLLRAKKGIYGMKEAPLLWFLTHTGVTEDLGMVRSRLKRFCFLHNDSRGQLDGLIGVHVDDGLITGTKGFFNTIGISYESASNIADETRPTVRARASCIVVARLIVAVIFWCTWICKTTSTRRRLCPWTVLEKPSLICL